MSLKKILSVEGNGRSVKHACNGQKGWTSSVPQFGDLLSTGLQTVTQGSACNNYYDSFELKLESITTISDESW